MSNTNETAVVGESAEELTEKSRLRSLFTARDEAAQAIRDAPLREYEIQQHPAGEEIIGEHVRAAVTAYVLECEALFKNTELGQSYWYNYDLPPVELPQTAPEGIATGPTGEPRDKEVLGVPDDLLDEQETRVQMEGIKSYIAVRSPIKIRWVGFKNKGFLGDSSDTATTTTGIPRRVSEDVFRATNKMLADLNIGLDAEQVTDSEASYDYSDLL